MPIKRSQFIKSIGLGAAFHLLESNAHYESTAQKQSRDELNKSQLIKNNLAIKPKALQQGTTIGLVSPASPVYNSGDAYPG